MNLNEFEKIICLYGCKEEKWPDEYKNDMVSFLKSSADAQEMLREYSLLEDGIASVGIDNISKDKINTSILNITSNANVATRSTSTAFYRIAAVIAVVAISIAVVISISDTNKVKGIQSANENNAITNDIKLVNNGNIPDKQGISIKRPIAVATNNTQFSNISDDSINSLFDDMQDEGLEASELLALLD